MAKPPDKNSGSFPEIEIDKIFKTLRDAVNQGSAVPPQPDLVNYTPPVDIYTIKDHLVVETELPGIKSEDIELSFIKDTLIIKGVKQEIVSNEKGHYVCMERGFGAFFRSVDMPFPVDAGNIKAVYKNGILTVKARKIEDKRGLPRRVEIESE